MEIDELKIMIEQIKNFFKNKFNLILTIIQALALILFAFGSVWGVCTIIGLIIEGVFLIVWGIKMFVGNKSIKSKEELLSALPIDQSESEKMQKRNKITIKGNRFQGVMLILLGILIIFVVFGAF